MAIVARSGARDCVRWIIIGQSPQGYSPAAGAGSSTAK